MEPARPVAAALAVRDGRIVAVGLDAELRPLAAVHARRRPRRADRAAGLPGRARPPAARRLGDAPLRPPRPAVGSRRLPRRASARTPRRIPTSPGSSAAAGRCPPSRAARRRAATSTRSCRIARSTWRTATRTARGSNSGPWPWRGSPPRRRTRPTAGSSASRTAARRERSTRARRTSSSGSLPTVHAGAVGGRASSRAQAYLHGFGITAITDAWVTAGAPPGLPRARRARRADPAHEPVALVGPRRAASSSSPGSRRRAARRPSAASGRRPSS